MRKIVYIHVPKCGGSSFAAALRLRFLMSQRQIPLDHEIDPDLRGEDLIHARYAARQQDLHAFINDGVRCITGHVQPSPWAFAQAGYAWVTMLRPPEERFLSHYAYLQRRHPDPGRAETLERFLDTADARRLASQYLFYFGGRSQDRCIEISAMIERSIGCLSQFDLVGDLAAPDAFHGALSRLAGGGILRLHRNAAPARTRIPRPLRAQIEALCGADRAIYEAATQNRMAA